MIFAIVDFAEGDVQMEKERKKSSLVAHRKAREDNE